MKRSLRFFVFVLLVACLALPGCSRGQATPIPAIATPTPQPPGNPPASVYVLPHVVLQRLEVTFLGQDGNRRIGSGCPGNDGKGSTVDYHLRVSGVDEDRTVRRVVVAGDNSTLTWAWPCSDTWGLEADDAGHGAWDIYIAPSEASMIYTVLFFYDDDSMAMGMTGIQAAGTGGGPAAGPSYYFAFNFGSCLQDGYDSASGFYYRDMGPNEPSASVRLTLSAGDLQAIYQKIRTSGFFGYPNEFVSTPASTPGPLVSPAPHYYLIVHDRTSTNAVSWVDDRDGPVSRETEALRELMQFIAQTLEKYPEVKGLPRPSGGCL
ncbi:MAG TPA: hypothetical protein VMC09_13240 [Anaerolineales bacterium]|nr:hypothetical protein [Anaerolineales bacterium]